MHSVVNGPEPGVTIANGATVIASQSRGPQDDFVILAHYGDEYVTWSAYQNKEGEWVTVSGHYFSDVTEAAIDLRKRSGGDMREVKEWVDEIVNFHADA